MNRFISGNRPWSIESRGVTEVQSTLGAMRRELLRRRQSVRSPIVDLVASLASQGFVLVYVVLSVVFFAQVFGNISPAINAISLYICLLCVLFSCTVLVWRADYVPVLCITILFAVIIGEKIAFSFVSGYGFGLSGFVEYISSFSFCVFAAFRSKLKNVLQALNISSCVYLVFYIYYSITGLDVTGKDTLDIVGYVGAYDDRDARLTLAICFAGFVANYNFARVSERIMGVNRTYNMSFLINIISFLIAIAAFYYSQSRTIQLMLLISFIFCLNIRGLNIIIPRVALLVFLSVAVVFIYGVFDPGFNPFPMNSADSSAVARYYEFEVSRRFISAYPLTGLGFSTVDPFLFQSFVGSEAALAPSDLGVIGVWVQFGLVGLFLSIVITVLAFFPPKFRDLDATDELALRATMLMSALYGVIAPTLFLGSGRFFLGMFLYAMYRYSSFDKAGRASRSKSGAAF